MQKIKIMLLSLALFAVIGGALAFKAKIHNNWCTTNAYSDNSGPGGSVKYFCSSTFGVVNGTTTTTCGSASIVGIEADPATGAVKKVCTTQIDAGLSPCDKVCDQLTTTKTD